jgi:adenosylcobinamide-phosphate synthase
MGGGILVTLVVGISTLIPLILLLVSYRFNYYLGFVLETIMCYQIMATKSLKTESMKVYQAFEQGDVEKARYAVSMIVGRDTESLTGEGIIKATVETVAENTSDGVIAPLLYMAIGGPVLGFFYKAVNTLDSMVGYKNEEYLYFGRASAKLDDLLNLIPARISGVFFVISAFLCRLDGRNAWKIFLRDRYNHASPNSAQTESAVAGALHVMLAGDAYYFGKHYAKKTIGDKDRDIEPRDIVHVNRMMYCSAILGLVFFLCIHICILYLIY